MSFTIKSRNTEGVAVLYLSGRIVLGEETDRLEETPTERSWQGRHPPGIARSLRRRW